MTLHNYRKRFLWYLSLILVLMLVGCSEDASSKILSSEEVYDLLKKEKSDLVKGNNEYFNLIGIKPIHYKLKNDNIFVYEFQNENDIEKALQDFNEQTKLKNMQVPIKYTSKNIMVLYLPEKNNPPNKDISGALKDFIIIQ